MSRKKELQLYDDACLILDDPQYPDEAHALLAAVCFAVVKNDRKPRKKVTEETKLTVTAQQFWEYLKKSGFGFNTTDYQFPRLNKVLSKIHNLSTDDPEILRQYLLGCLEPWMNEKGMSLTWNLIVRKFPTYLENARSWVNWDSAVELGERFR